MMIFKKMLLVQNNIFTLILVHFNSKKVFQKRFYNGLEWILRKMWTSVTAVWKEVSDELTGR